MASRCSISRRRQVAHDGTWTGGVYHGLDRFGRLRAQRWVDGGYAPHPTLPDRPLFPAVYEDELSYDAGSRILSKVDRRLGAYLPRRDRRYTYDGLDRLVEEQPGVQADDAWISGWNHDGSAAWTAAGIDPNEWTLDTLGNWKAWNVDSDFSGSLGGLEVATGAAHNAANELLQQTYPTPSGPAARPLTYDAAGNLRATPAGVAECTYDA